MEKFLSYMGQDVNSLSNIIWALAMPFLIVITIIISIKIIFKIKNKTTPSEGIGIIKTFKNSVVTMGTIIGTGALVGVLGSLSTMASEGQTYIEGVCIWGLLGLLILAPFAYSETLMARIVKLSTKDYITKFLGAKTANFYKLIFIIIFVFGFGGFQFSAINAAVNMVLIKSGNQNLGTLDTFSMIVIPLMIILSAVVLLKKEGLILKALTTLTTISVSLYIIFFFVFLFKTDNYIPVFLYRMFESIKNPVSMMIGMPLGLMVGIQKLMQTADVGIGVFGMAANSNKGNDREAALASSIVLLMLFIVGILATTYVTSYGVEHHKMILKTSNANVLLGFYNSAISVTGIFGLIAVAGFSILTGISALLGRYYYLRRILNLSDNKIVAMYIILLSITGTFAVFGFSLVFNMVDLLIFVAFAINIMAIYKFTMRKQWELYIISK